MESDSCAARRIERVGAARLLAWALLGLLLAGAALAQTPAALAQTPVVRFAVERFAVEGPNPLSPEETEAVLSPYLGEHEGLEGLLAAAEELQAALQRRGLPFHRVVLPPQEMEAGVVILRVVTLTLANVTVTGNEHFGEANILRSLPTLRVGETPDAVATSRAVTLANEHPSKEVTVRFRDSAKAEALDAELRVADQRPWTLFALLSNTGTDETGDWRLSVGGQHTNLFDRDHSLTASYTTSPEQPADVQQAALSYFFPLYDFGGTGLVYYTMSDVDSGFVGDFNVRGKGDFWGASYTHHLPPRGPYRHEASVGFDNSFFDNEDTVAVGVFQNLPPEVRRLENVRSTPLWVRYFGAYEAATWQADFDIRYLRNLELGGHNDDFNFQQNTGGRGGEADWEAVRLFANFTWRLPRDLTARAIVEAQVAAEPLIAGEQLGLGGIYSVRGFDERELTGDGGARLTFELWSPPLYYGIQALGFLDVGYAKVQGLGGEDNLRAFQPRTDTIAGAGVGVRWQWKGHLSVGLDVANVIEGIDVEGGRNEGTKKAHLSVFLRY